MKKILLLLCILFFAASLVSEEGLLSGKVVIKSKNSQFKISIPYRAFVLKGQLEVAPNVTHFHLKSNNSLRSAQGKYFVYKSKTRAKS